MAILTASGRAALAAALQIPRPPPQSAPIRPICGPGPRPYPATGGASPAAARALDLIAAAKDATRDEGFAAEDEALADELIEAIKTIAQGNIYFSREVSNEILRSLSNRTEEEVYHLTEREIEIVKLIAQELSNAEIANKLCISERTVETHRKNIYRKTNTKTIVGLIKYAVEHKLI